MPERCGRTPKLEALVRECPGCIDCKPEPEPTQGGVPDEAEVGSGVRGLVSVVEALHRAAERPHSAQGHVHVGPAVLKEAARQLENGRKHFKEDLLSDEAVEAAGKAVYDSESRKIDAPWSRLRAMDKAEYRTSGRMALEAALSISREGERG